MVDIARNHQAADTAVRTTAGPRTAPVPPAAAPPRPNEVGYNGPAGRFRVDGDDATRRPTAEPGVRSTTAAGYLLAGVRIALGWVFLWAFLDKTFGLGFATPS